MRCCGQIFEAYDIWKIKDNANFTARFLSLGVCTECEKDVVTLIEIRKEDGQIFRDRKTGGETIDFIDKYISQIEASSKDFKLPQYVPSDIACWGENKEIHNTKGKLIAIRQYRCDSFGRRELVKEYAI